MQSIRQYRQLHDWVQRNHTNNLNQSPNDYNPGSLERNAQYPSNSETTLEEDGVRIVEWDGPDDYCNPRAWPLWKRSAILCLLWLNVWALDWAGSADSQASAKSSAEFHVIEEAETLSPALYNFGIGLGALFAGPISGKNDVSSSAREALNILSQKRSGAILYILDRESFKSRGCWVRPSLPISVGNASLDF